MNVPFYWLIGIVDVLKMHKNPASEIGNSWTREQFRKRNQRNFEKKILKIGKCKV